MKQNSQLRFPFVPRPFCLSFQCHISYAVFVRQLWIGQVCWPVTKYGYFVRPHSIFGSQHPHLAKKSDPVPEMCALFPNMRRWIQSGQRGIFSSLYNTDAQLSQGKGPHPLLWAGSRAARWKILISFKPHQINYCLIFRFDVWLTVHRSSIWNKKQTRCHLVYVYFYLSVAQLVVLRTFQRTHEQLTESDCLHSQRTTPHVRENTTKSSAPEDGHMVARNMLSNW